MKKIILFLLIIYSVISANLVDVYRNEGLIAVQKQLEKQLSSKAYWEKYLEDKNVDYGYYESKKYVILAQKKLKEISLYKIDGKNYNLVLKNSVIVGENDGDKKIEGDKKTPTGVYDLTKKLTNLDAFYGPLALVTNYPNIFDKTLNKKGYGIWIHGMPSNKKREDFTKGCIALENIKLKQLDEKIDLNDSVLVITEKKIRKASKNDISIILSSIYKWRDAWRDSNINKYIEFYSKSFKKNNGMDLEKFTSYKKRIFLKKEKKKIKFTNINISPYPNSLNKQMYKITMSEDYKTKYFSFNGKKELYIELKNDKIEILVEG